MHTRACRTARAASRRGFTIIELLTVIVVVAALVTIAIARFADSKRRAYIATMKSDLHNLGLTAEQTFATENSYESLTSPRGTSGVTLTFVGTATGWTATARHEGLPDFSCVVRGGGGQDTEPLCR